MTVRDNDGSHLPYLPSRMVEEFTRASLLQLWAAFFESIKPEAPSKEMEAVRDQSLKLAEFVYDPKVTNDAHKGLSQYTRQFGHLDSFIKLRRFIERLGAYYLPVVGLPPSSDEFRYLHHGVDVNLRARPGVGSDGGPVEPSYSSRDILWLSVSGRSRIDILLPLDVINAPPWKETQSLHVRAILPAGMIIGRNPELLPSQFFEGTRIAELTEPAETYVYSYVGKADAVRFVNNLTDEEKEIEREEDRVKAVHTRLRADFSALRARANALEESAKKASKSSKSARGQGRTLVREVVWIYVQLARLLLRGRGVRRQRRRLIARRELAEARRQPTLRIRVKISPTMTFLLALLWTVVLVTLGVDYVGQLSVDAYLALLGSLLLVVVTLALFALDKPFLRIPFAGHLVLSLIVFLGAPLAPGGESLLVHALLAARNLLF